MAAQSTINFEVVSKTALAMITQGVKPTVRGVIAVTGGKTETVSQLLRDFHDKRNAEVLKMADELGSSAIARLLADEVQAVVERKTANMQQVMDEQRDQLTEVIELLSEKEKDCQHRIEMAEAKAVQAINDANEAISKANARSEQAEDRANALAITTQEAQQHAEETVAATNAKCDLLVNNANNEAKALVEAADKRADKAEQEAGSLREQVKLLSIEQAKREIEQAQYAATVAEHQKVVEQLADDRATLIKAQTQQENLALDVSRLNSELIEAKGDGKLLASAQGQLLELQKQLSQAQTELFQSERERESLSLALRNNAQE